MHTRTVALWTTCILALIAFQGVARGEAYRFTDPKAAPAIGPLSENDLLGSVILAQEQRVDNTRFMTLLQKTTSRNRTLTRYWSQRASRIHSEALDGTGEVGEAMANAGQIDAFSADFRRPLKWGTVEYNIFSLDSGPLGSVSQAKQDLLSELWGRHYESLGEGSTGTRRNCAEAFSMAIWEILNESNQSLDVKRGTFSSRANNSNQSRVLTLANEFLASLGSSDPLETTYEIFGLIPTVGSFQPLLVGLPTPIPEPATLVSLLGLGLTLGCVRLYRRRRTAKQRTGRRSQNRRAPDDSGFDLQTALVNCSRKRNLREQFFLAGGRCKRHA